MLAVAALALQALALPARAQASAYSAVERAYAQDGTVPPCRFSTAVLEQALKQAPTYDQEYFGDFIGAVQSALRERAGGACASHRTSGAARAVGPSGPLPPEPPLPPSITSPTAASIPWPLLVALGLLVAGCAGAAGVAVARSRGWDPRWAEAARHAWREAEWRAGGAWEAVRDRWRRPLSR
jgi:hypothetical protein